MSNSRAVISSDDDLGKFILTYLPAELKELGVDTSDLYTVNSCDKRIADIPNKDILRSLVQGLDLHQSDSPFGYNLLDQNPRDYTFGIRIGGGKKLFDFKQRLSALDTDTIKQKILKLIVEKSSQRAAKFIQAIEEGVKNYHVLGNIPNNLHLAKQFMPLQTIKDVIEINNLFDAMDKEYEATIAASLSSTALSWRQLIKNDRARLQDPGLSADMGRCHVMHLRNLIEEARKSEPSALAPELTAFKPPKANASEQAKPEISSNQDQSVSSSSTVEVEIPRPRFS